MTFGYLFKWLGSNLDVKIIRYHPFHFLDSALDKAATRVQHFFGSIVLAREPGMTTFLTFAAKTQSSHGDELAAVTRDTFNTHQRMQTVFLPWFVTHRLAPVKTSVGNATKSASAAKAKAAHATTTAAHATTIAQGKLGAKDRVKVTPSQAGAHPHARSTTLTIPQAIGNISGRTGRLEHAQRTTAIDLSWLKSRFAALTFAGLVVASLTRSGLGFLRCPSLKRIGNNVGCKGFAFLEELMALSFVPLVLGDACKLVHTIERLAVKVQPEISAFVLGVEGWLCGGTSSLPSAIVKGDLKRVGALPSGLD